MVLLLIITCVLISAREGGRLLHNLTGLQRSDIIYNLADLLVSKKADIKISNDRDLELAEMAKLDPAIIDRLKLSDEKIDSLAIGEHSQD
jgi:gamma-glutamyl phosphate reductase